MSETVKLDGSNCMHNIPGADKCGYCARSSKPLYPSSVAHLPCKGPEGGATYCIPVARNSDNQTRAKPPDVKPAK